MREVVLDRQGVAPIRDGFILVSSEIEFLKLATGLENLQVRGTLCDWAQNFCEGRNIKFTEVSSPTLEIMAICPTDEDSAYKIYNDIGHRNFEAIDRPLTIEKLLMALYPGKIWNEMPSIRHAAEWLLWLIEHNPKNHISLLLQEKCDKWIRKFNAPEKIAYQATNLESAEELVNCWLGIQYNPKFARFTEFPLVIPNKLKNTARKKWGKSIIETNGSCLDVTTFWPKAPALKKMLAEEAFQYFKNHAGGLTENRFKLLADYLSWQEQQVLQILLPPPAVSDIPEHPDEVLDWFSNEYLPYRRWQFGTASKDAEKILLERAKSFVFWYLEYYPKALSGGTKAQFLSFHKTASLTKSNKEFVTLIIVMDGLHVGDAHTLHLKIQELTPRLSVTKDELVFTTVPTVTEFCKDALFKGVRPSHSDQVEPVGKIIPESEVPVLKLEQAQHGDIFLWRVQEPDHTYHLRNKYDALIRKVEAELDATARTIRDIVDQLPAEIPLQLVITTDHGRVIGKSKRIIPIPPKMESHGRAAWGKADIAFGSSGYNVQGNLVFLDAERFGMKNDMAIPIGENTFLTSDGKSGEEAFTHGGLLPEEVIIPWIELIRDYVKPEVDIKAFGTATAGEAGILKISITNLSEVDITLVSLDIDLGSYKKVKSDIDFHVEGRTAKEFQIEIENWPTSKEINVSRLIGSIKQPNGLFFSLDLQLDIQSEEMYRRDNILEDLL